MEEERQQSDDDSLGELTEVSRDAHSTTNKRKRRNNHIVEEDFSSAATLLGDKLVEASAILVQPQVDLQDKTAKVSSELSEIHSLSETERFKVLGKIIGEPAAVLTFWNLEGEERETWVRFMLEE
ncbi:hypothetical protein OSB04_un000508 [Centaurea solstitialis]|uniref:Uncharacterized protein n=1 Tax=Centaurea solstitialis TaxID=347529 RepID=A0AA38W3J3_9ASTR|nr:hypothetical protein OSB04_un000508 [Centaurea solstitialis]